ncbi:hypothetical protein CWR43_27855 [Rhizobium sullae]|uniref:Uncharacterized protein n=1 Tax=Rhizobium sullae TaxID=50338 RepID=A0A2N0D2T3_RHISU|nr:hypothetical protein CWR43_27855 [Rhizobium sullae]
MFSLSEGMPFRLQRGARIAVSQHAPIGCDVNFEDFTMDFHPRAAGASNQRLIWATPLVLSRTPQNGPSCLHRSLKIKGFPVQPRIRLKFY